MSAAFISHLQSQIEATKEDGLYKKAVSYTHLTLPTILLV